MARVTDGGDVEIGIVGKVEGLNKAMDEAERTIRKRVGNISKTVGVAMTAVGVAIIGTLGVGLKTAADFEQAITNAASVTGKTGAEFEAARDKMAELAQTVRECGVSCRAGS